MEYRNEQNKTYNDGRYIVVRYETGKVLYIGTHEQCTNYIETKKGGDFDEYGIFEN